jgi:hypothetical protein
MNVELILWAIYLSGVILANIIAWNDVYIESVKKRIPFYIYASNLDVILNVLMFSLGSWFALCISDNKC